MKTVLIGLFSSSIVVMILTFAVLSLLLDILK